MSRKCVSESLVVLKRSALLDLLVRGYKPEEAARCALAVFHYGILHVEQPFSFGANTVGRAMHGLGVSGVCQGRW
jgi:hypothetical protein